MKIRVATLVANTAVKRLVRRARPVLEEDVLAGALLGRALERLL